MCKPALDKQLTTRYEACNQAFRRGNLHPLTTFACRFFAIPRAQQKRLPSHEKMF